MPKRRGLEWIDITMEFGAPAGTWPGDRAFEASWTGRIGDGEWAVNLSQFASSPHNGTHSDAPLHVLADGAASESLDLGAYLGPCVVVDATEIHGSQLPPTLAEELQEAAASRVLFKTHAEPPGPTFPKSFKGLSEALAKRLGALRIRLVGTDAPSMDAYDSKGLVAHKALFAAGVTVLENLDLSKVEAGPYELVALPLRVRGLCAAPVRALLRSLEK